MTNASRRFVVTAAAALALVAASCGGGSSEESSGGEVEKLDQGVASEVQNQLNTTTIAETATTAAGAVTTAATAPVTDPQTMDEWLKLWESERAAVVKRIKDNKWGHSADGKTLTGPEGWSVDLTECPPGWSNTQGLTDTEMLIGHTTALSGTLADYGNIGKGMDVLWDYANTSGGIKDSTGKTRKITMLMKDDGYDSARTIPLVEELVDSEKVFVMWTLGSPNTLKTYDYLNKQCVPQPILDDGPSRLG